MSFDFAAMRLAVCPCFALPQIKKRKKNEKTVAEFHQNLLAIIWPWFGPGMGKVRRPSINFQFVQIDAESRLQSLHAHFGKSLA